MNELHAIQEYLENTFHGCDVIPLRKNTKQVKYSHKNGAWDSQKARAHINECYEGGAAILLNEKIIVIDVDDVIWIDKIETLCPEFKNTVQTKTNKGKHYYFKRGNRPTPDKGGIRDSARQLSASQLRDDSASQLRDDSASQPLADEEGNHIIPIDVKTITLGTGDKTHQNQEYTRSVIVIPPTPGKQWINQLGLTEIIDIPQSFIDFYYQTFKGKTPSTACSSIRAPSTVSGIDYPCRDRMSCRDRMYSAVSTNEKDIIPLLTNML